MQSAAIPAGVTVSVIYFHIVQQHFWYVSFGGLATSPSGESTVGTKILSLYMFAENLFKRFITCFTAVLSVQPLGNSIEFFFFSLYSVCETSFECLSVLSAVRPVVVMLPRLGGGRHRAQTAVVAVNLKDE